MEAALVLAVGALLVAPAAYAAGEVTVWKTATCGCCKGWIEHMRANGFTVSAHDLEINDFVRMKSDRGVPANVQSCHTAVVDGYLVEGHVPADVVARLLRERPAVRGVSAPGMPAASPGMNDPNGGPYDVVTFDGEGRVGLYQRVVP